jgi:hypothetical protein
MWQDFVLMVISLFLSYAMIPQVRRGLKQKKRLISIATCTINFIGLYAESAIFLTLGLYFSSFVIFCGGTLWLIIFVQGIIYRN